MKTKKLTMMAAVIAALAISITSANALTYNQVQVIKKTVLSVPVPEMPAKAAEVVSKAEKKDRQATAVTAVRAIIDKHRTAAPEVISAVSKVAPDLAPAIAVAAAEVASEQSQAIAHAATVAAPGQAKEITVAMSSSVNARPSVSTSIASVNSSSTPARVTSNPAFVGSRGSASLGSQASSGVIIISDTPIAGGSFPSTPPSQAPAPVVIYSQPPSQ
jgi:hypothetical protein